MRGAKRTTAIALLLGTVRLSRTVARPLEIVRIHGDAPLSLLASEVFHLSQFHPTSGFIPSRLPMPLHYADRMIKEVQHLDHLSVLYGVDRSKIFAA